MFFIKKLILGLAAVILIYVGGNGTQSSNLLFQGGGFVGMIVGFVVLYIFAGYGLSAGFADYLFDCRFYSLCDRRF